MPAELAPAAPSLALGFALVFARLAGLFVYFPMPGAQSAIALPRLLFAAALTLAMRPWWPRFAELPTAAGLAAAALGELFLGVAASLLLLFLHEALAWAGQLIGLQAGFSYASTVDPSSQADSTVLTVIAQMTGSLLFFALGLDRLLIRALAASLAKYPPGAVWTRLAQPGEPERWLEAARVAGGAMLETGMRLALPAVALLLLTDLALALFGRVNAQLQLLTLSYPAKTALVMGLLVLIAGSIPAVYRQLAETCLGALMGLWGGRNG
jgi:flagellar biosynthetic protein FliR